MSSLLPAQAANRSLNSLCEHGAIRRVWARGPAAIQFPPGLHCAPMNGPAKFWLLITASDNATMAAVSPDAASEKSRLAGSDVTSTPPPGEYDTPFTIC